MKTFAAIIILILTSPVWIFIACIFVPCFMILGFATSIAVLMEWAWNVINPPRKPAPKRYAQYIK